MTYMLKSMAYSSLSSRSVHLLQLMQRHWHNERPIDYGVREAQEHLNCAFNTARKVFHELHERGFIVKMDESEFNSRTGSKARSWRLTYMPYMSARPTNDWENWVDKKNPTDATIACKRVL